MHIHLDPVGGIAGDMFVAALIDAFPDLADLVVNTVRQAGLDDNVQLGIVNFDDGVLTGKKFNVGNSHSATAHSHHQDHGHTHWAELRKRFEASNIPNGVKQHVLGIFGELAKAEAKVHGKDVETVSFHEVGNWDSIADIVAASTLIDALSPSSWSIASLPMGRGRVKTAHGELPVPAPATALLLAGFALHDDGRPGERVTPTGAAILKYLSPASGIGATPRILRATGYGFGTRKLSGLSNTLRVLAFDENDEVDTTSDTVGIIQFEIDDQNGEELAVALDHIRGSEGVIDVTQSMALGKKGRMMAAIQVLARPDRLDEISDCCFRQTTTLGLRMRMERRSILARREVKADGVRVKIAERSGGATAKAEMDEVANISMGHSARSAARRAAEDQVLREQNS